MSAQKPSVGRIVHYRSRGSADGVFPAVCRAALVTEVHGVFNVSLAVVNPTGLFFDRELTHTGSSAGETVQPGTWHWHTECPDAEPDTTTAVERGQAIQKDLDAYYQAGGYSVR
jgi:hypothetical protein